MKKFGSGRANVAKADENKYFLKKKCSTCGGEFAVRDLCIKKGQRFVFCTQECARNRPIYTLFKGRLTKEEADFISKCKKKRRLTINNEKLIAMMKKKGFYEKEKHLYQDKIIAYPDSPNGKAYIGTAKQPLMPNENGLGFKGVLIQDETRKFVQCYGCGDWFTQVHSKHIKKCCGLEMDDYKEKYGFNKDRGMVSDEVSRLRTASVLEAAKKSVAMREVQENVWKMHFRRKNLGGKGCRRTAERFNDWGTCPEQIKQRLKSFIIENHYLPNDANRGRRIWNVLKNRFGSWNKALQHYGLPQVFDERKKIKKFVFDNGMVVLCNTAEPSDRDTLFDTIKKQCAFLQ